VIEGVLYNYNCSKLSRKITQGSILFMSGAKGNNYSFTQI